MGELVKIANINVRGLADKQRCLDVFDWLKATKMTMYSLDKGQSWGFTSRSTARVILGQVLTIATCGTRTHRGDSL